MIITLDSQSLENTNKTIQGQNNNNKELKHCMICNANTDLKSMLYIYILYDQKWQQNNDLRGENISNGGGE